MNIKSDWLILTHGGHVGHVHSCPRLPSHGPGLHHVHGLVLQEAYQGHQRGAQGAREKEEESENNLERK